MGWFEDVTGTSNEQREGYRRNKEALGGRTINQQNLDEAARIGALGRDSSGNIHRDPSAYDRQRERERQAPQPATQSDALRARRTPQQVPGGNITVRPAGGDYIDMIMDSAFGAPAVFPAGPRTASPGNGPFPMPRPGQHVEEQRVEHALQNGMSLEMIMGGAIGGTAALIAKSIWDQMNRHPAATGPYNGGDATGPNMGAGTPNNGNGGGGNNLTSPNPRIVNGQPMDGVDPVDATFTEIFGLPNDTRPTGPFEPRLITGPDGNTNEVREAPYSGGQSAIPGPNERPKQITNQSSNNFDESVGGRALDAEAEYYANQMEIYGDYDPANYGITPETRPDLYERLTRIIRN